MIKVISLKCHSFSAEKEQFLQCNFFTAFISIMNLKLIVTLILTLSGCSYQVIDIANRYFNYPTKQFVSVRLIDDIHMPSVSVCWPMTEIIKPLIDKLTIKGDKSQTTRSVSPLHLKLYEMLGTFTVEDIFNSLPPKDDILKVDPGCAVRLPGEMSWRHPWYNNTECYEMFTITTFIHRLTACYKFTANPKIGKLQMNLNTMSPSKPGFIYMLFLNEDLFQNMSAFTAYGHTLSSSPLFDSVFSIEKVVKSKGTGFQIGIVTSPVTAKSLPAPYDTSCRQHENFTSGTEFQLHHLNKETMRIMNHVHTMEHVKEPYKYLMFSPVEFRNQTINNQFVKLFAKYRRNGSKYCYLKYNIPVTRIESDNRVTVAVNWSQDNEVVTSTVPDQLFIDFLIYVCSSVGIWMGLSVFSVIDMFCDKFASQLHLKHDVKKKITINTCKHDISVMRLNNQFLMLFQKLSNVEQKCVTQMKMNDDRRDIENALLRNEVEKMKRKTAMKSD